MVNTTEFSKTECQNQRIEEAHLDVILKDFRRDGYVVLKDAFPKDYIHTLYLTFMNQYERFLTNESPNGAVELSNKRLQISVEVNDAFNSPQLYANSFVFPVIAQLFNNQFIINSLTCVASLPGATEMSGHFDARIFTWHPVATLLPPHAVGALIPLIPFNQLNGPTRVWPGSQRSGPSSAELVDKSNFIDVEMDIGSCMLMDYRLFHSGNPNLSEQIRPLLYINYSAPWYYDEINFKTQAPLRVDDANFNQIPESHRNLFVRRHLKPPVDFKASE